MQTGSMRCSKCGFTQMASPTCKSCGTAVNGQPDVKSQPQAQVKPIQNIAPAQPKPVKDISQNVNKEEPPAATTNTDQARQLFFHGTGGSLFGIQMVNAFLTIITLGIYHF